MMEENKLNHIGIVDQLLRIEKNKIRNRKYIRSRSDSLNQIKPVIEKREELMRAR